MLNPGTFLDSADLKLLVDGKKAEDMCQNIDMKVSYSTDWLDYIRRFVSSMENA